MSEALKKVENQIRQVRAEIEAIQAAQSANGGAISNEDMSLLISYNNLLAVLLKKENTLRSARQDITLEDLFARWGISVDPAVLNRMRSNYSSRVSIILIEQQREFALQTYEMTKMLPGTTTALQIRQTQGYALRGVLHSWRSLVSCYKGSRSYVLKVLSAEDYEASIAMRNDLAPGSEGMVTFHPHIVPIHLFVVAGKHCCVMPKYTSSFEPCPGLSDESDVTFLWNCMSSALHFLHENGYAHMDVKPSNICFSEQGYVLIDLGSARKFGECTSSTKAYLPRELTKSEFLSSASTDWWMLAMVLIEKVCGHSCAYNHFRKKVEVLSLLEASPMRSCFEEIFEHLF